MPFIIGISHNYLALTNGKVYRVGFRQVVSIKRLSAHFTKEKHWQPQEENLLRMLWPSASWETLAAALPERTPAAINKKACKLKLKRQWERKPLDKAQRWTEEDKKQLSELYTKGSSIGEIAIKLGRTERAIKTRAFMIGVHRPRGFYPRKVKPVWEAENIKVMQDSMSPSGEGGSSFKRGAKPPSFLFLSFERG